MSLLDQIQADIKQIITDVNGFGQEITLEAPSGETATVIGLTSKHHLAVDTDGNRVNSKNAHISVSELSLVNQDYPVRNPSTKEVKMKDHKVTVKDSTGEDCTYLIAETYPSETVGLIVCILRDLE